MIFPIVSVLYMIKALHTDKGKVIYIPISSDHRQFLGFAFQGRAYEYNGIPFGLSLSRSQNAWFAALFLCGRRAFNYVQRLTGVCSIRVSGTKPHRNCVGTPGCSQVSFESSKEPPGCLLLCLCFGRCRVLAHEFEHGQEHALGNMVAT